MIQPFLPLCPRLLLPLLAASFALMMPGVPLHAITPSREEGAPSARPLPSGNVKFVDAKTGSDSADGSRSNPWRTITRALEALEPGETLFLREGVYYENVRIALQGRKGEPITLRAYPGERAVIDGGLREFFEEPDKSWEPVTDGAQGEYRSTRAYRNARDVIGRISGGIWPGLQTYWHAQDLRASNERWEKADDGKDVKPVYCGPGLWYNAETARIHARFAPTHLKTVPNYQGKDDPRQLPLVIASFNAVPVTFDGARHVRLQDLVIRGGGYDTIILRHASDLDLENLTIRCGTYGLRSEGASRVRIFGCGFYGGIPPWGFREENSWRSGNEGRDIARLPGHALLVTHGQEESSVYYEPLNNDWEVSYCDFLDGHDGVYWTGKDMRFHHNRLDGFQDDALFLSTPTPNATDRIYISENFITRTLMAFSMAGRLESTGSVYIYRNVIDLREGGNSRRNVAVEGDLSKRGESPFKWHADNESYFIYQNTFIMPTVQGGYAGRAYGDITANDTRRVINNLFVYLGKYPFMRPPKALTPVQDALFDYNLHWSVVEGDQVPPKFFSAVRTSPISKATAEAGIGEWEVNSFAANPAFLSFSPEPGAENDYRLTPESRALRAGMALPPSYPDAFPASAQPDLGALPSGTGLFAPGRAAIPLAKHQP